LFWDGENLCQKEILIYTEEVCGARNINADE
jgi:hypothetical protein